MRTQGVRRPVSSTMAVGPELYEGAERHPFQVQAGRCDILAQITRCDLEASFREGCKELGLDQVDLPEIG